MKVLVECRTLSHEEVLECVETALRDMRVESLRHVYQRKDAPSTFVALITKNRGRLRLKVKIETSQQILKEFRALGRIKVSCVSASARCLDGCVDSAAEADLLGDLRDRISSELMSKRAGG